MSAVEERFQAKIRKTETCWIWTACKDGGGYGLLKVSRRMVKAHRFSYELHIGAIPPGMVVDHMCHVRECVNPAHLQAVTHKQNAENFAKEYSNSRSGVRGVSWHKASNSWRAQVRHGDTVHHLGTFPTVEEAEAAAIAGRNSFHSNNLKDRNAQ
jgi:hypothetical protein